jgi:hypothetical protein
LAARTDSIIIVRRAKLPTLERRDGAVADVRVHLVSEIGSAEGDVLLSRVPCVGEDISMPGLPEAELLRVQHVIHRAFLRKPPASEYEAVVTVLRVRLPEPA